MESLLFAINLATSSNCW